jgi:NAD(P)-dependent dehydrogenase (short-subunit alcohol dehydrogenase family)
MRELREKTVVVTDLATDTGRAVAEAAAKAGATVAGLNLPNSTAASEIRQRIEQAGRTALFVEGSASDADQLVAFANHTLERFGKIDIWVNSPGCTLYKPFLETTLDDWTSMVYASFTKCLFGCQAAIKAMLPRGEGVIVNISAINAPEPIANLASYFAAKGAISHLTQALAAEFGPQGIKVNSIALGAVDPAVAAAACTRIPARAVPKADKIANAVVFLASAASHYVNGHELVVEAGLIPGECLTYTLTAAE